MSTLALVFWVVAIAVVFRVVAEQGGWSGFLTWLTAKFGAVGTSATSPSNGNNTSPAGGAAGNSLGQAARQALSNALGGG